MIFVEISFFEVNVGFFGIFSNFVLLNKFEELLKNENFWTDATF